MRPQIEKPETQDRRLEPTGVARPGKTRGLTGTGPGLARQDAGGRIFGRFWNRTEPFIWSKPGPLAGYLDPLLTLLPDDKNRLPKVWTEFSKEQYQTTAIPWNHPKPCSWSLYRLRAKRCRWWGCGLATYAKTHCESSLCRPCGQFAAYKQPPTWKLVVARMDCTGWTVVRGFALWVGIFLALWRVDGWVMIWSFSVRFWVSFWCFVDFIITSFIFMHEGLCWELMMLRSIFTMCNFGNGIVAPRGLRVWRICNW